MSAEVTDADRDKAARIVGSMSDVVLGRLLKRDIAQALADQRAAANDGHEWCCPSCGATTRARMADQDDGGLRALAEWLISLDDDDPTSPGRIHRRTVNLTEIIGRARAALDPPTPEPCTAHHDVTEDGVTATWTCQQLGAHGTHKDSSGKEWTA